MRARAARGRPGTPCPRAHAFLLPQILPEAPARHAPVARAAASGMLRLLRAAAACDAGAGARAALLPAGPAYAQDVTIDLGEGQSFSLRTVQLFLLITLLSLAPGLAIMVTCFPFMVTVLSILRQAIGVQQAPPNMMIVSLALFLPGS